jgi:hypothetical protein
LEGDDPEYLCDAEGNTSFVCYEDAVAVVVLNLEKEIKA